MFVCRFSCFIRSLWYTANSFTAQSTTFHGIPIFNVVPLHFCQLKVPKLEQKFVLLFHSEFALWICFECTFTILWLYIFAVYQWDWLVVTKWVLTPDTLMHYFFQDFDTWWETKKVHHNVGCCATLKIFTWSYSDSIL